MNGASTANGRHRDEQEQHHLAPGLVDRGAEEDRPGERHGDEGVARAAGGGQLDQRGQPGPAGPEAPVTRWTSAAGSCGRPGPTARARGASRADRFAAVASDIRM